MPIPLTSRRRKETASGNLFGADERPLPEPKLVIHPELDVLPGVDRALVSKHPKTFSKAGVRISLGDSLSMYDDWQSPVVIVADGPYGVKGYPGDPPTPEGLGSWYSPHIEAWARRSTPLTTLWFWNTEVGWA